VRDLENDVKSRLRRRAERHGRSMEDEVRNILRQAVAADDHSVRKLGSRIAGRFRETGLTADFPELLGEATRPATFDE
jgi:plasmid stability protein